MAAPARRKHALFWLTALALAAAGPAHASPAQEAPHAHAAESREKATIRKVIADPVFGGEKEELEWRYTGAASNDVPKLPDADFSWLKTLADLVEFVSKALRFVVWIGIALLLAALVYLSYRYRHAWLGRLKPRSAPPEFLFGLDVRPESLPDDVVTAALAEVARGNATGALSLLYRAALVSLIHRSQLDFHAGHTEDDCLRLTRQAVDTGCSRYFAELLEAWKLTAYAHQTPPAAALEALCQRWGAHFAKVGVAR